MKIKTCLYLDYTLDARMPIGMHINKADKKDSRVKGSMKVNINSPRQKGS